VVAFEEGIATAPNDDQEGPCSSSSILQQTGTPKLAGKKVTRKWMHYAKNKFNNF
jgi:hypothetical protein